MNLEEEIEKIVKANDANFYDTEIVTEAEGTIFRIFITQEGGINLDTCAKISRELSPFLDVYPPMSNHYRLEVSSPGIERKLIKLSHFKSAIGEKVKTRVLGVGKVKGILKIADKDSFVLETKNGEERFQYSDLGTTKTYYDWN
jgi:ribosome maturation factor RimP